MSMENVKVIHMNTKCRNWDKEKQIALDFFFLYFMQFSWRSDPVLRKIMIFIDITTLYSVML